MDKIFYHAHCLDGAMAALVALDRYPKAKAIPINYGEILDLTKIVDAKVLFVDFCPTPEQVLALDSIAKSVLILDHHEGAIDKFTDDWFRDNKLARTTMVFDMKQSGAGLALRELNPTYPYISIIEAVEDRDLWRFHHPATKEVCAYLSLYIEDLNQLSYVIDKYTTTDMADYGNIIVEYKQTLVESIAEKARHSIWQDSYVAVADAPPMIASELGNYMLIAYPELEIAVVYSIMTNGQTKVSLRSRKEDEDINVNRRAAKYGGGGHPSAASFYCESIESVGLCK